jgi:transposase
VLRCKIILLLDEANGRKNTREHVAATLNVSLATITKTIHRYLDGGIQKVIQYHRNPNSDTANRKIDLKSELEIVNLSRRPAPEGAPRWTMKLLEEHAQSALNLVVSRETIRKVLRKYKVKLVPARRSSARKTARIVERIAE